MDAMTSTTDTVACKRVLVVDDDDDTRRLLARFLEYQGHKVDVAEDGRAALVALERFDAQVILLDMMMPHLDGLGFLEVMRRNRRWDSMSVIVFTGQAIGIDMGRLKTLGVAGVMIKASTDFRHLAALVQAA